jgi:hypothetical protein
MWRPKFLPLGNGPLAVQFSVGRVARRQLRGRRPVGLGVPLGSRRRSKRQRPRCFRDQFIAAD